MIDGFGRNIDYIRISLTDKCNLRCVYCMPKSGVKNIPHAEILSFEALIRLCRIFARLGIRHVKLTGGEPLVRKDLSFLIKQLKTVGGIKTISLTTNGTLLEKHIESLVDAGLNAVNISLDTKNRAAYQQITRTDKLGDVLLGISKAISCPNLNVKINCVPIYNYNDDDVLGIAEMARDNALSVRFIELMPIGSGRQYQGVDEKSIRLILEKAYGKLTPSKAKLGNGPGRYYRAESFRGNIGFISALSHNFCGSCNRIRLTSDGFLQTCLQYRRGVDLKKMMRALCSDYDIENAVRRAIIEKPSGHHFLLPGTGNNKTMSQIGG